MSIRKLKEEVLSLSTDINNGAGNDDELTNRMARLINTIEIMRKERISSIKSLPSSLHASPARRRVSPRKATSTSRTEKQQEQGEQETPSRVEAESQTKRALFSPDSDDDSPMDSPTKSYLPSPDPPPIRSPSVLRNPLYDSPDPYLTGDPGSSFKHEGEEQGEWEARVQSLAGGFQQPPLDFSPQHDNHHLSGPDSFVWPVEARQNDPIFQLLVEMKQAVFALQESQTVIIRALNNQAPSTPFLSAIQEDRGVKFQTYNEGEGDGGLSSPRQVLIKSLKSFRIKHDSTGVHRKEITSPPMPRSGSIASRTISNLSPSQSLRWLSPQSNEEKLKIDNAASVIQVGPPYVCGYYILIFAITFLSQRHFRRYQSKKSIFHSGNMSPQLQKVQVVAKIYELKEDVSHASDTIEESTGMKKRFISKMDSRNLNSSNTDLWSKARLRIEHLKREESKGDVLSSSYVASSVEPSFPSIGGAVIEPQVATGSVVSSFEKLKVIAEAVTSIIGLLLSFITILYELLATALRPVTTPMKGWVLLQHQHLSNSGDVRVRAMVLVVISFILVSVGALAYHLATGASWPSSFFYVYSILFNVPGTDLTSEGSLYGLVLTNCIFLVGVLVFAVLLGMIGEEVANQIVLLRSGTGPLKLNGHILILNSNSELAPLLSQIQAAGMIKGHVFSGRSIVILADESKEDLEQKKSECLTYIESKKGTKGLMDIHTRSGKPYSYDDLALVSAQTAQFVVLLYPHVSSSMVESENISTSQRLRLSDQADRQEAKAESLKAATVAAMATLGRTKDQNLVVQFPLEVKPEHGQLEVVNNLLKNQGVEVSVCRIPEVKVIDRLIAQTALQPGVLTVLRRILRQGNGLTFEYININKQIIEMSSRSERKILYSELRRLFGISCCIIGYIRLGPDIHLLPPACGSLNQRTRLNPEEDEELRVGDQLIGIVSSFVSPLPWAENLPFMHESSHKAIQRLSRVSYQQTSYIHSKPYP